MEKANKIIESLEEEVCLLLKKQPLQPQDIEMISKLTDSIKDVATASGMQDYVDAYLETNDGVSYAVKMPKMSYDSFARGRSPITGRFVSRDGVPIGAHHVSYDRDYTPHDMSRRYDGGYSGHSINDRMISALEMQMDHATSDYERNQIQNEIEHLRTKH